MCCASYSQLQAKHRARNTGQALLLYRPINWVLRDKGERLKKRTRLLGLSTGEPDRQEGLCGTVVTNSSLKDMAKGAPKELCFVLHKAVFHSSFVYVFAFFNSQLRSYFVREALLITLSAPQSAAPPLKLFLSIIHLPVCLSVIFYLRGS